ncbi:DUF11 domain-containing protein [Deinococcus sp. HMF7620]|uniref:DUF11 domain-containing protein n=1 Tax=Deinococcus arboris TaxID=2682977 RepID=A0A7C9HTP1_9DEIO|nr:DUF11 domain-containing protein [Deinococcus arboris]MVN88733.1 DUF11 domain-containing protein [Deinococcus arboris]
MSRLSVRLLCTVVGLSLLSSALAVGTPVNTSISNTATLNYRDALNAPRTQTSNPVTVTVRQVYALSLTPDAAENAIPLSRQFSAQAGASRLIGYELVNAGNGPDTLTLGVTQSATDGFDVTTRLLPDANCDGTVDSAVPLGAAQTLAADERLCVYVEATVPAGAPTGAAARLTLTAASQGNPAVTDTENYAQVTVSAAGQLDITKTVSPTGSALPGAPLTYTVSGSVPAGNPVGAVSGVLTVDGVPRSGVLVRDVLTTLEFGAVTAASASSGAATALYSTDGGATWTAAVPASGVNAVALLVEGTGAFLPAGSTLTLSFTASIPAGTLAGTVVRNSAAATLDGNGDGDGTDPGETPVTPDTTTTVGTVVGAAVGPAAFPQGGASGSYTLRGTAIDRSGDTQTTTTPVTAGGNVTFRQTVLNTGNASNDFTLAVAGAPSGWTCTVQSISSSDTLGTLTNPVTLSAGQSLDFAVDCALPYGAAGTTNVVLTVSATPAGGSADTTTSTVAQVSAAGAPLLGNGDLNPATAPSQAGVTVATNPGTTASFPLELQNNGPVAETYTLSSTLTGTQLYADTNCDGTPDGAAITLTPSVAPGATLCLVAQQPVAAGTAAGETPVTFTATSTVTPSRTTSVTDTLRVNAVVSGTFGPDGAQSTIPGGSVTYSHTLTNTSNGAADFTVLPFTSAQGFVYSYATSSGGPFASTLSGTLAPGASTPLFVRVNVPASTAGTPAEAAAISVTLEAQAAPQPAATLQVTDTTTVQNVLASVVKSVRLCADVSCTVTSAITGGQVSPGDVLQYTLTVQNSGSSPLNGAVLIDTVPANTTFRALGGNNAALLYSVDGGGSWTATPPGALPTGDFQAGLDTNGDNVVDTADILAPGTSFEVTFTVQVN